MTSWTIRRAETANAVALARCVDAAYSVYAERDLELPAVSEGLAEDILNNVVWVAILDERIVGGLVLILHEGYGTLANVAVDPSATGLGIARALIDQAELEARKLKLGRLVLNTHVDIPENVRLYEHLGWRETGRAGNKVHMEKALTGSY